MKSKFIVVIVILIACLALLAGAFVLARLDISGLQLDLDEAAKSGSLQSESIEGLKSAKTELEASKAALEAEKAELEKKLAELEGKLTDAGAFYEGEIEGLKGEIAAKAAAIAALETDIAKYRTVFNIDVLEQAKLIGEIIDYIDKENPFVRRLIVDEDGENNSGDKKEEKYEILLLSDLIAEEQKKVTEEELTLFTEEELAESGLTKEELTELKLRERVFADENITPAHIGIYYEDLTTGYHFEHNSELTFDVASVIKAPYVMSVLKAVSAEEKAYFDALEAAKEASSKATNATETAENGEAPADDTETADPYALTVDTDGDGIPDRIKIEYSDPKYDLYEKVKYDKKTMYRSGSGVIKDMEDGTEFTYLDFVKYVLEQSDNIAYQQLRNRFGYSTMYALANSLRVSIVNNKMTAPACGKLFKAIYEFIETDETYGPVMRESMRKGNHTVIIPLALYGKTVLHKYGWDEAAYNDAAIVLAGDHPYVITVLTDLDCGGNEVNEYLRELVKKIDRLHSGFYAN